MQIYSQIFRDIQRYSLHRYPAILSDIGRYGKILKGDATGLRITEGMSRI